MNTSSSADSGDDGQVAMCTFDAYADHPDRQGYLAAECLPHNDDGTCPGCDAVCVEVMLDGCPLETCGQPDVPCAEGCENPTVLCQESIGTECCYVVTASYGGPIPGRPLRHRGVPCLPSLEVEGPSATASSRAAAAGIYREFALYERASVEAFEQVAATLQALGAAADLVQAHREAAAEECAHAELALAAAHALDGRLAHLSANDRSAAPDDLGSFVRDLVHDGCFGEAFATAEAAWALAQAEVRAFPELRRYWLRVVDEESRHAALAWRTLEWLLTSRPELRADIVAQLRAASVAKEELRGEHDLERFGIPAASTTTELRKRLVGHLVDAATTRAIAAASSPIA
jgi:hypothetical protein